MCKKSCGNCNEGCKRGVAVVSPDEDKDTGVFKRVSNKKCACSKKSKKEIEEEEELEEALSLEVFTW